MSKSGRPPINLGEKIRDLLSHTEQLSPDAASPIAHYREAMNASFALIAYIERHLSKGTSYEAVRARHMGLLHRFVLLNLIEAFERFVKSLAAECVDHLAPYVTDDRFDAFTAKGSEVVAHFESASIGKALCESDTWLNNNRINDRFRRLLASPNGNHWTESMFPSRTQQPIAEQARAETLAILWQLRHTLAHNSGVLTGSDSMRLRTLAGRAVDKDRLLSPTGVDLRHAKRFLEETADVTNRRVASRLSAVLSEIFASSQSLPASQALADRLARTFQVDVTIGGYTGLFKI